MKLPDNEGDGELSNKEAIEIYENGKQRRFNLLFSVNGGAFALTKLMIGGDTANRIITSTDNVVLGGLTLYTLAIGMVLFTAVMFVDLLAFALNKQKQGLTLKPIVKVFGKPGYLILVSIHSLISIGWLLAIDKINNWGMLAIFVSFIVLALLVRELKKRDCI